MRAGLARLATMRALLRTLPDVARLLTRLVSDPVLPRPVKIALAAAAVYLVNPFDLIPDEIPFLGFLDDATVVSFAVARTRKSLDDFMIWETTAL